MNNLIKKFAFSILLIFSIVNLNAHDINIYTTEEPPLNFTDNKNKNLALGDDVTGFTSDIVKEIIKRNNYNAQISLIPWARAYNYTLHQKNTFIYSMARTKMREKLFKWVGPIVLKKAILFQNRNSNYNIKSLNDAKKVDSIGIILEDSKHQYLKKNGFDNLVNTNYFVKGMKLLINNRISLWAQTDFDSPIIAKRANLDINQIYPALVISKLYIYIGVSKNTSDELVQTWQKTLDEIKLDGTFEKLANKWATHFNVNWVVKDDMLQVDYEVVQKN